MVTDDICLSPHLSRIWDTVIRRDNRYTFWEFTEGTIGVAAATRVADQPILPSDLEAQ